MVAGKGGAHVEVPGGDEQRVLAGHRHRVDVLGPAVLGDGALEQQQAQRGRVGGVGEVLQAEVQVELAVLARPHLNVKVLRTWKRARVVRDSTWMSRLD